MAQETPRNSTRIFHVHSHPSRKTQPFALLPSALPANTTSGPPTTQLSKFSMGVRLCLSPLSTRSPSPFPLLSCRTTRLGGGSATERRVRATAILRRFHPRSRRDGVVRPLLETVSFTRLGGTLLLGFGDQRIVVDEGPSTQSPSGGLTTAHPLPRIPQHVIDLRYGTKHKRGKKKNTKETKRWCMRQSVPYCGRPRLVSKSSSASRRIRRGSFPLHQQDT